MHKVLSRNTPDQFIIQDELCFTICMYVGSIPAAQLALDYINDNGTILPGYFLKIKIYDDKVSVA